jgi:signal transduction histidine kinase
MAEPEPAKTFAELLSSEMHPLNRAVQWIVYPAGRVIFTEGDDGDGIYFVEKGCVEISARVSGDERRVLARLEPRAFFGEMAVVDNRPRSATATAEVETHVSFMPRAEVFSALQRSPDLVIALMRAFSHRMREFDRRYLHEVFQAERLALVGRFAQSIVHDFKNPLNMIGFAADVGCAEDATPEIRFETKTMIRKQVDRLANMISELLEFTRGSSRNVALTPGCYRKFVHQVLADIRPEAAERNVSIQCENDLSEVSVLLDETRLLHVFYNLMNNAMDVMPQGGTITVRFSVTERDVVTELEDTGPGIAPEIAPRLFEPFATHGKSHGTGLGLSICKRIIEDHQGSICARSEPNRGAVFCFALPRALNS